MPLFWNKIKSRAVDFSNEWKDTTREEGTFLRNTSLVYDK
jgi:hypothetical protein